MIQRSRRRGEESTEEKRHGDDARPTDGVLRTQDDGTMACYVRKTTERTGGPPALRLAEVQPLCLVLVVERWWDLCQGRGGGDGGERFDEV